MARVDCVRAVGFFLALWLVGCGGTSTASSVDGGRGVCVDDARKPVGCQTKWTLVDPCKLAAKATTLEAAVFANKCPPDSVLAGGDTSLAIERQSVAPGQPVLPAQGLEQKLYGFAFLFRDDACHVIAWGCTEADLGAVTEVRTNLRDWSAQDTCTPATGGGCAAPATCSAGACR